MCVNISDTNLMLGMNIILLLSAIVLGAIALRQYRSAHEWRIAADKKAQELFVEKDMNWTLRKAQADVKRAVYRVAVYDGFVMVERISKCYGYDCTVNIKCFTDPDQSFNIREAEELVDLLNEK